MYVRGLLCSTAAAALALAIAPSAHAQASSTAAAAAPSGVQEVVVTATKRAENVQNVPISLEVVTAQAVQAFHADTLRSIAVPNMNVQAVGGNDVIYIRGFGSPSQNYAFDQAVSLYVDGIYSGKSRQFMAPFFDVERVEVLRGPQGALFGKNTAAGAISIISGQPTSVFHGEGTAIYNFDQAGYELSGHVSGPLTDKLAGRFAARFVDQDGWISNRALGDKEPTNESQLARASLKYTDQAFDYYAKVEYGHNHSHGSATVSGPLTTEQRPILSRYGTDDIGRLGEVGFDTTSWNIAGTGNLHLGDFVLTSVTGYSFFHATHVNSFDQTIPGTANVTPPTVFNSYPEHFQQWSQEVRLQSPAGRKLDYIIGGYYDNAQYRVTQFSEYTIAGLGYFLMHSRFRQQAESFSLFGQATYHVTDRLRLLGSVRYSHTNKRGQFTSASLAGPFPLRPVTSANGQISEGNVDPSITVQYDLAPRVMVYATYGEGSKSGGFVSNTYGTKDATFVFQPEHSRNIEAGVKSTWLEGKLVLNGAVFKTEFDNLQVSIYNSTVQAYIVGNAARASSTGAEFSASWYPLPNLDFSALGAIQDVKYDDYPGAQCLASQSLAQCNPAIPASVQANNLAGSPLPNISKFSGSLQGHYVATLPNDLRLSTTLSLVARSKYFNSDDESPLYGRQNGFAKLNARIELAPVGRRWRVALVGTNLTDEITTAGAFRLPTPITPVSRAIYWVEPSRNISIEAGFSF